LDLGCGARAFPAVPDGVTSVVRVDVAEEGVRGARDHDRRDPRVQHAVTDAHHLAFADATFAAVVFADAIEHMRDAEAVLREAGGVRAPGGEMLVTSANRDSLNQVMTRKLGYPEFVTNHQHIREFSGAEIDAMLAAAGLTPIDTAGVFLYPYWGVPGID